MNIDALGRCLHEWGNAELSSMASHMLSTAGGGRSIETWITPSMGKYLSQKLKIDTLTIHYEKRYPNSRYRCDICIGDFWIEVKHIWLETQNKIEERLNRDIERIAMGGQGVLVVFEIGTMPKWYDGWKVNVGSDVMCIPVEGNNFP